MLRSRLHRRFIKVPYGSLLLLGFASLSACSGVVNGDPSGPNGDPTRPGFGESGRVNKDGTPIANGEGGSEGPVDPGVMPLRRLTNTEYRNTVQDLLGVSEAEVGSLTLVPDVSGGFFASNADVQSLSAAHLDAYDVAARKLASMVMSSATRRNKVVGCDVVAQRTTCMRSFITSFGKRAYRRPLQPAEVDTLLALESAESDAVEGLTLVVRALLQAPHFLFRPETGTPDPKKQGLHRLTGYEVATRLSYLLWATTPSDELLTLADGNELHDDQTLRALASDMLKTERAKSNLRDFVQDWLHLRKLPAVELDKARFPDWGEELKRSMAEESVRYIEDFLWSDDQSFMDFLDARHTFVDARLAKIYGVTAPAAGQWQRIDFPTDVPRAGLLTQPSVLALTGRQNGTSAIWRGKFVRESLLCEAMPPPPADVGEIKEPEKGVSERERLEQHRTNPACAGCHRALDPLGFGLSAYDAIGAYKTQDEFGNTIDDSGHLEGSDRPAFRGAVELASRLKASPQATLCVAEMLGQHLLGRGRTPSDDALMTALHHAFTSSDHSAPAIVLAFVQSDAFRYRRANP